MTVAAAQEIAGRIAPAKLAESAQRVGRGVAVGVAGAFVFQIALLVIAGLRNRHMLNPDATAYIQLAREYASGQFHIAVSGYWGPMLSWLLVPIMAVIHQPLDAARIAMGLSAVMFLVGCVSVFRSFNLHPAAVVLGAWIVAIASISWSVENITPDLLMTGWLCLAMSRLISPKWIESARNQWITGLLFGAAYLTKAVALPAAFLITAGIGASLVLTRRADFRVVVKAAGMTLLAAILLASPWIGTLSAKYGGIVVSTSAKINHAIVGPPDVERRPPDVYEKPEPGRITSGEDPIHYDYHFWSPFDSVEYFKYQLKLIFSNIAMEFDFLSNFDRLHVGLLAVVFGFLVHRPWRENMAKEPWRWVGVPIACVCSIYFPVYAFDLRYYYPAYPLLIIASMGLVVYLTRNGQQKLNAARWIGLALVTVSFLHPLLTTFPRALQGIPNIAATRAEGFADRIKSAGMQGPIAGAGDCRAYYAQYVSFLLQQRYFGCEDKPTMDKVKKSEANFIIVSRQSPLIEKLDQDSSFVNLDALLFESQSQAAGSALRAYRIESSQ